MSDDFYEVRWMFGLLDYGHWRVFYLGKELGLIILNSADRSVAVQWFDDAPISQTFDIPRGYRAASEWVAAHEVAY